MALEVAPTAPARGVRDRIDAAPPQSYFVGSAVFHYLGPSLAVLLFARVAPLGVAWLRIVSAGLLFAVWRRPWRVLRTVDRATVFLLVGLGVVLAVMNGCFYLAIDRLPLATVAAIEFLPVIGLAALGVRTRRNGLALGLAGIGVYLLTKVELQGQPLGVAFAFANAGLFALYIVLAHRVAVSGSIPRLDGLAVSMLVAAVAITPIGGWSVAGRLLDPVVLGAGIGIGVTSSVIPYVCDQLAMARLPRATYAMFVATLPAVATVVGVIVLAQLPSPTDLAGIGLIMAGVASHRPAATADRTPGPARSVLAGAESQADGSHRHPDLSASHEPLVDRALTGRAGEVSGPAPPASQRSPSRDELLRSAEVVLERLAVAPGETFLVVSTPESEALATVLGETARLRTRNVCMRRCEPATRDGQEPPAAVAEAMREASAVALLTRYSLSHTQARVEATRAGARIASLPGITEELFARAIPVDYVRLEEAGRALAAALSDANTCRVRAPGGTDVRFSLRGRRAISDDGDLRVRGAFGNLPAGEAFIAPIEADANGVIVFDGSLSSWGMLAQPLRIELKRGRVIAWTDGDAGAWLMRTLDAGGPNGRVIAELGIGTNPGARLTGNILGDEKALGTIQSPSAPTPGWVAPTKPPFISTAWCATRVSSSTDGPCSTAATLPPTLARNRTALTAGSRPARMQPRPPPRIHSRAQWPRLWRKHLLAESDA